MSSKQLNYVNKNKDFVSLCINMCTHIDIRWKCQIELFFIRCGVSRHVEKYMDWILLKNGNDFQFLKLNNIQIPFG